MYKSLFVLLMLMFETKFFAQDSKLFFINGQYFDTERELSQVYLSSNVPGKEDEIHTRYFTSCLYRLSAGSLVVVDTLAYYDTKNLSNSNEDLHSIRIYQDNKVLLIYAKKHLGRSMKDTIILKQINFNNPYNIFRNFFVDEPLYKYWMVSKNDSIYFIYEKISGGKSTLWGKHIPTQKTFPVLPDILNYYISSGYNGLGLDDIYGGWGANTEKIELVRRVHKMDSIFQINYTNAEFTLPLKAELIRIDTSLVSITPEGHYIRLSISTGNMLVLPRRAIKIDGEWYRNYLIYNKNKNKWQEKLLIGSYPSFRAFGSWLGGSKTYMTTKGYTERREIGKNIPGKAFRNQDYSDFTSPADFRFDKLEIFPTGLLFLYNIDTENYIEWEAMENGALQGDSEILLVEKENVYYRVNNSIFMRPILDKELGNEQLLVKDDMVRSVHWAFISSK